MSRTVTSLTFACVLLALAGTAHAQFATSGTGTVAVTVSPEASIQINTAAVTLTSVGTNFADYTGTTNFTYKVRTGASVGTAGITLRVTSDFSGTGGPSVLNSGTTGDTLKYTCNVTAPALSCSGSPTTSTIASTPVATFGAGVSSFKVGNAGSVSWDLINDPAYAVGTYTATVTYTISAT
jgi:hypothetical protein